MSGSKRTEALDRARKAADQLKPVADHMKDQVKPLAKTTGQAARRQVFRTRVWAAPRVERTGKALTETVAPKVSALLSSAAERIDPVGQRRRQWRKPVGIAAAIAAAASAVAAVFRNRAKIIQAGFIGSAGSADSADSGSADSAGSAGSAGSAASTDGQSGASDAAPTRSRTDAATGGERKAHTG